MIDKSEIIINCKDFENRDIERIVFTWLKFAEEKKMEERRRVFIRLVFLAGGSNFFLSDLDKMAGFILNLDHRKPEVKKVRTWFRNAYSGIKTEKKEDQMELGV